MLTSNKMAKPLRFVFPPRFTVVPEPVALSYENFHMLLASPITLILEETVTPGRYLAFPFLFWTTGQQGVKRLFTYRPKRLIPWPVLTRPLAGFEVTTEGRLFNLNTHAKNMRTMQLGKLANGYLHFIVRGLKFQQEPKSDIFFLNVRVIAVDQFGDGHSFPLNLSKNAIPKPSDRIRYFPPTQYW